MVQTPRPGWRLLFGWLGNREGLAGLVCGFAVWVLSLGALGLAMRANQAASMVGRTHDFGGAETAIHGLHARAVAWSLGFTSLQIGCLLVFTFVLRACYRLRTAICFSMGAGFVIFGDLLGLLGVLVWVGWTQRVG